MYLGIDTHTRYSQVAVVDGDGNLQDEIRLPNDRLSELAEQYAGGETAIEASGHYRPVYEMLDEHLDVTLVNPSKNRLIADATVKTDRIDAKRLAHMLRADMLAESYVPSDEIRTLRDLVRTRKASSTNGQLRKTASELSSSVPTMPTTANCSVQLDESSSRNSRSVTPIGRLSRLICP